MRVKKSLGQHFLKSEKALLSIVNAGEISKSDKILEIGPGYGALTEKLLATGAQIIAVEKDDGLYDLLKEKFRNENFELIHADILDTEVPNGKWKLIANIPYNITGAIFKKFLESDNPPVTMVLLVQKEVAERIVARDDKESILSISVKVYGEPRYVETVKAGSFAPAPQVDSAIIAIENISKNFFHSPSGEIVEKDFFQLVHAGFKSKRKKLMSNLSTIFDKERVQTVFQKLNLDENVRAEDTDLQTWRTLANSLLNNQ